MPSCLGIEYWYRMLVLNVRVQYLRRAALVLIVGVQYLCRAAVRVSVANSLKVVL
jgi:hypothetical protein